MKCRFVVPVLALATLASSRAAENLAEHPIAAAGNFELHPALELSLFAREPDVVSPVGLAFDEFGRAYVVEMRDYPYGFGPERKPGGTVRLLEDRDGDGRAETSTVFAEQLSFPTSITPWNGGVLVTAPPEILFLKDTDGDGKADVREVVLAGFQLAVTDSNLNGLRIGLDNWIHACNGGNGGTVRSPARGGDPVRLGERDFRFNPATGDIELTTHTGGGFGLVFDEWGRSFTTHNINHMKQRVADVDYFTRFPGLPPIETTHSISDHGEMARIHPISVAQTRPNHPEQAGHFSSAGGMGHLGHSGWPGDLSGSVFVCDVVGNIVHRDLLVSDGPIFKATRPPDEQTREFFASRDNSFRPTGLELGPDGALYLLDMQRDVIEHPDYIPAVVREKLNLRAGEDRGRIYRILPKRREGLIRAIQTAGTGDPRTPERELLPGRATTQQLVQLLGSPNAWTRLTAQRLLVSQKRSEAAPAVRAILQDQPRGAPHARLHALWTLEGLGRIEDTDILNFLEHTEEAGSAENAMRIIERHPPASPKLQAAVLECLRNADTPARFQAALVVGSAIPAGNNTALAEFLAQDGGNPWMRRAALSSVASGEASLLASLLDIPSFRAAPSPDRLPIVEDLAGLVGARAADSSFTRLTGLLEKAVSGGLAEPWTVALLSGLGDGLRRAQVRPGISEGARTALQRLGSAPSMRILTAAWRVNRLLGLPDTPAQKEALARATKIAKETDAPEERRLEAIRLVALGELGESGPVLFALLDGREPASIQRAALEVIREHKDRKIGDDLVSAWPFLSPTLRPAVVNLLVYRSEFQEALLSGIESGRLQIGALNLDLEHRRELLREASPEIRRRAAKFTSDEEYSNRKEAVNEWLAKLPAQGDRTNGRLVFERVCAQCHLAAGIGFGVGPELTGMSHRSVEDILSNILDPNMAMNPAYVAYTAELADGESETGILAGEGASTVTLLQAQGRRIELRRTAMIQLRSDGRSLMPEGLEAGLTPQDLRDLIAFLQEPPAPAGARAARTEGTP